MDTDQAKEQDKLFQAYQRVFSTPDGKKVLKDLCHHCNILSSTKGTDPYDTYFNEGQRSIGMHVLHMLSVDLRRFREMIQSTIQGDDDV